MSELYLIAHKVRGEAAFDIAQRLPELDRDGEVAWIIPSIGHRVYPFWAEPLKHFITMNVISNNANIAWICDQPTWGYGTSSIPIADWRDFYSVNDLRYYKAIDEMSDEATNPEVDVLQGQSLAERLGIKRPQAPTITRRI